VPNATDPIARETISRVIRRLIPFIFICYVVAYIDRVNIGFAAKELQRDLGFSAAVYGFGAGLFFALINALGNLGGFVGPTAIGWLRQGSGDYKSGMLMLAGVLVVEAALVASLRLPSERPVRAAAKTGSV
jgi:nitrate/nitrite transporter NarK